MKNQNKLLLMMVSGLLLIPTLLSGQGTRICAPMKVASGGIFQIGMTGSTIINADPAQGVGKILNEGEMIIGKSGLILKSNDTDDGLLANHATVSIAGISPADVQVSKIFTPDKWYFLSFPFDVKVNEIRSISQILSYTFTTPTSSSPFYLMSYNGARRSVENKKEDVWDIVPAGSTLKAGQGYLFSVDGTAPAPNFEIIFPAAAIADLFDDSRQIPLVNHIHNDPQYTTQFRAGWNCVGNLSTSNVFVKSSAPASYSGGFQFFNGSGYDAVSTALDEGKVMSPYCAYLTQLNALSYGYPSDGTVVANVIFNKQDNTVIPYTTLPHLRTATSAPDVLPIALEGANYKDLLRIGTQDRFKEEVFFNEDVSKLVSGNIPQIWNQYQDYPLAINLLSKAVNRTLTLGIQTAKAGNYTISIPETYQGYYSQVNLLDKETGIRTDLLKNAYQFYANNLNTTTRFALELSTATALSIKEPMSSNDNIRIYATQSVLHVSGIEAGDKINAYDMTGRLLMSAKSNGETFESKLATDSKILLVRINGKINKTAKVLND